MSNKKNRSRSLADPAVLSTTDGDGNIRAVIEMPKGNRNRYSFDEGRKVFTLNKVSAVCAVFPSEAGDADATDARVFKKKTGERNDRIIAIEEANTHAYGRNVKDLSKKFYKELEELFANCHETQGKKYRVIDIKGPAEARRRVGDGIKVRKRKT